MHSVECLRKSVCQCTQFLHYASSIRQSSQRYSVNIGIVHYALVVNHPHLVNNCPYAASTFKFAISVKNYIKRWVEFLKFLTQTVFPRKICFQLRYRLFVYQLCTENAISVWYALQRNTYLHYASVFNLVKLLTYLYIMNLSQSLKRSRYYK